MTTRSRLLERIRVLIAGRAAEDVTYGAGKATTYAIGSIKDVYKLAEKVAPLEGRRVEKGKKIGATDSRLTATLCVSPPLPRW